MPDGRGERSRVIPRNPGLLLAKGVWAVTDQGLFAVSNFFLSVTLARWLTPKDYGAFAVAFTVFLLLGSFHTALLSEPMLVFGQGRYRGRHSEYLRVLLSGHWGLVLLGSVILGCAAAVFWRFGSGALASALLGFAFSGPAILLLWFMRRACYIGLEPQLAASGGLVYLVLMAGGLAALYRCGWLSTVPALSVMGFASLVASLWLALRLGIAAAPLTGTDLAREALRDHWGYGRWSVATMPLLWISGDLFYVFLALGWGLEASAALKAMANLILPVQHIGSALSVLSVPILVRARGELEFGRLAHVSVAVLGGGSLVYWGLLVALHRPIMTALYGGQYAGHVDVLWMLGLVLLGSAVVSGLGGALRARERPDQVFRAYGLSSLVVVTFGLWSTLTWGVMGAAVGLALSSATKAAAMWTYYRRSGGSHGHHGAPDLAGAMRVL
jgi:O-antigen/teichoic acid export membrane protein